MIMLYDCSQQIAYQSLSLLISKPMQLQRSLTPLFLILMLLTSQAHSMQTFALHHMPEPQHQSVHLQQQHQSSYVIYHNMRNLHFGGHNHALHLSSAPETHGINSMGYFFTINMTIQGIPYSLNIDTGSSDIFIKGEDSKGKPDRKYSCPQCKKDNKHYSVSYLDGTLHTYVKEVNVDFGRHHFKENILVAFYAPKNFQVPQGLVGLSFPHLSRNPNPNFIQTLINNKIINRYAFGVNLNFQNNHSSSITFGQPDHSKYQGELLKVPIMSIHSYIIRLDSVQVGSSNHFVVYQALLDTGNSCVSFPDQFQGMILEQFNNGPNKCGFCKEPFAPMFSLLRCVVKDFEKMPAISIWIKSTRFEITKDAYIQRCVQDGDVTLCDSYVEIMVGQSQVIIGDSFFNRYYSYFDLEAKEVGFAKNNENLSYKNMYKPYKDLDKDDIQYFDGLKKK